jgi:hypothetical protein
MRFLKKWQRNRDLFAPFGRPAAESWERPIPFGRARVPPRVALLAAHLVVVRERHSVSPSEARSPLAARSAPRPAPIVRLLSHSHLRWDVAVLVCVVFAGPALAIPSPDVMVNLFASATQVLGVLTLIFGRWFVTSRARAKQGGSGGASRIAFWIAASLAVVSSLGWFLYYTAVRDANLARLQVNLTRESSEEGKKILDVSLKELSFSDQLKREDAITTEDLAGWIERGEQHQVLDIRESEEFEVGASRACATCASPTCGPRRRRTSTRSARWCCCASTATAARSSPPSSRPRATSAVS